MTTQQNLLDLVPPPPGLPTLNEARAMKTKRAKRGGFNEPTIMVPTSFLLELLELFKQKADKSNPKWRERFRLVQQLEARAYGVYDQKVKK